jgi:hypothetical protein
MGRTSALNAIQEEIKMKKKLLIGKDKAKVVQTNYILDDFEPDTAELQYWIGMVLERIEQMEKEDV